MPHDVVPEFDAVAAIRVIAEVLDGLSVALYLLDDNLRALHWNRTFLKFFPEHDGHMTVGEHYSLNLRRFYEARLDRDELPQIQRYIDDGVARGLAQLLPFDFKHRGQWLRAASLPIPLPGALPGSGVGTAGGRIRIWTPIARPNDDPATLDVLAATAPSQAAQAIEDIADGVLLVGGDERVHAVNDRFLLLYQIDSRRHVIGRTYRDVLAHCAERAAPEPGALDRALLAITDNRRFAGAPFEVPLPGGRWIRVIERRTACGTTVSTHLDVTEMHRLRQQSEDARRAAEALNRTLIEQARERERAEQALREANRWLSLAEQMAHVGHWLFDRATRRLSWSDEMFRIFGRDRAAGAAEVDPASLVFEPGERERLTGLITRALETGEAFEAPLRIVRPDGEIRSTRTRAVPQCGDDGRMHSLFGVLVDETEQVRAEEKLRQAEKMQVIGGLAAGVAHDFNNILTVVMGKLALIGQSLPPGTPDSLHAADALAEAQRGADLTQNLLGFARRQVLAPVRLDVAQLIEEQQGFLSRTLGAQIAVETDIAHPQPDGHSAGGLLPEAPIPDVLADRAQLQTALMNLAINAAHAMPLGGRLRLGLRATRIDADGPSGSPSSRPLSPGTLSPGDYVVITVSDTGTGMPPEVRDRAFDPFFTTKGVDGLGLGLPMVHGFSRQSGGDARIFSAPGEGTRVEIWLPAAPHAPAPHPTGSHAAAQPPVAPQAAPAPDITPRHTARPETAPGTLGRILVVDDQPAVLDVVATMLRLAGFGVVEAASAADALALVAEHDGDGDGFDAIVTDYTMPGLTGVDLVHRARALRPAVPAVIITGYAEIDAFDPALHDSLVMTKPFKREALIRAVSSLVARRRAIVAG